MEGILPEPPEPLRLLDAREEGVPVRGPRSKKAPPELPTVTRVAWLEWLVNRYGPESVATWREAPVSLDRWAAGRVIIERPRRSYRGREP